MSIVNWFDILADGMRKGVEFLYAIDLGGISLAEYLIGIFIMSLCFTLFLHVVAIGPSLMGRARSRSRRESENKKGD